MLAFVSIEVVSSFLYATALKREEPDIIKSVGIAVTYKLFTGEDPSVFIIWSPSIPSSVNVNTLL